MFYFVKTANDQRYGPADIDTLVSWVGEGRLEPDTTLIERGTERHCRADSIAAVAAGLLIGNHGRTLAMSEKTIERIDLFWELIDEILNGVLFVLLGFELLILMFDLSSFIAGLIAIPVVLLARLIGVSVPIWLRKFKREFSPNAIKVLTWGGLRDGISVALALSLPPSPQRELILMMTYVVVVFSILVQGLTIGKLVQRGMEN